MFGFNQAPPEIVLPMRKLLQNIVFGIGATLALLSIGAYSAGDYGPMLVCAAVSIATFYLGGKIRTTKKAKRQITEY